MYTDNIVKPTRSSRTSIIVSPKIPPDNIGPIETKETEVNRLMTTIDDSIQILSNQSRYP